MPFIQVDPSSKRLVVTEEARTYLSQVSGTVGVVAVAGVYRTGKSYILNQLAGTTGSGFGVGNSVQDGGPRDPRERRGSQLLEVA